MFRSLFGFLLFLYTFSTLYAEESVLINNLSSSNIIENDGVLIVNNGVANVGNIDEPVLSIDTSDSPNIRKVIVRNLKVNSSNARILGSDSQSGIVEINTDVSTYLNNVNVSSRGAYIRNISSGSLGCASILCQRFNTNDIVSQNVNVNAYGVNRFESEID